jgi:hypothetical protein
LGRQPALSKWLETCGYSLCEANRYDGIELCAEREVYYEHLLDIKRALIPETMVQLRAHLQELVEKIRRTYTETRTAPMHALVQAQRLLGYTYQAFDTAQSSNAYAAALRSYGVHTKQNPPKHSPANRSQLSRDSLIIHTNYFSSRIDMNFACVMLMTTLAEFQRRLGKQMLVRHWAVAALWSKAVMRVGWHPKLTYPSIPSSRGFQWPGEKLPLGFNGRGARPHTGPCGAIERVLVSQVM